MAQHKRRLDAIGRAALRAERRHIPANLPADARQLVERHVEAAIGRALGGAAKLLDELVPAPPADQGDRGDPAVE